MAFMDGGSAEKKWGKKKGETITQAEIPEESFRWFNPFFSFFYSDIRPNSLINPMYFTLDLLRKMVIVLIYVLCFKYSIVQVVLVGTIHLFALFFAIAVRPFWGSVLNGFNIANESMISVFGFVMEIFWYPKGLGTSNFNLIGKFLSVALGFSLFAVGAGLMAWAIILIFYKQKDKEQKKRLKIHNYIWQERKARGERDVSDHHVCHKCQCGKTKDDISSSELSVVTEQNLVGEEDSSGIEDQSEKKKKQKKSKSKRKKKKKDE